MNTRDQTHENTIHILIADQNAVDRTHLKKLLEDITLSTQVFEACDQQACLNEAKQQHYDCIFLEDELARANDFLSQLHRQAKPSAIVILNSQTPQSWTSQLRKSVFEYLHKDQINTATLSRLLQNINHFQQAKQMERQVEALNARHRYLINNSPAIIYSAVPSGDFKITFVSDNLKRILGYQAEEMLNDPDFWINHIHPDDIPGIFSKLPHLFVEGRQTHDYRFRHKNGYYLWIHDTLRLIRDADGEPLEVIGSLLDITERKSMEQALHKEKEEQKALIKKLHEAREQLLQNEKMAAIGQLAAGVAHEINNPIGYINSNLHTLLNYTRGLIELVQLYQVSEPLLTSYPEILSLIHSVKEKIDLDYTKIDILELLDESQEGTGRVKQIVQDLKEFSHVDESEWQKTDLHKGLDSTLNIARNEIKYKAEIVKNYGEIPLVECIASQINQVFMNLLVNAAHAVEENGVITLSSGCENGQVWIEVKDNGKGIAPDVLSRIFDPFYTTKPVGVGTGLGLSLSYNIINKHGGHIDVESTPKQGACFRVWLPVKQHEKKAEPIS